MLLPPLLLVTTTTLLPLCRRVLSRVGGPGLLQRLLPSFGIERVKAQRLQDWQKLKKYVPVHKQGDVCPNGVPALPEKSNADSDSDSE